MVEPIFNSGQMSRLVKKDPYLLMVYNDLLKRGHSHEIVLEVLYNSNVLEDSLMTSAYQACRTENG